ISSRSPLLIVICSAVWAIRQTQDTQARDRSPGNSEAGHWQSIPGRALDVVNDHDAHRAAARFHFESELIAQSLLELRPVRIGFRFRLRHELDRKVELSLKAGGVDDGPSGVNPLAEHVSHGCDRHVTATEA